MTSSRSKYCIACFLLVLAIAGTQLIAQMSVSGTLTGIVMDPSGQVVPGANLTLTSIKTNAVLKTTTNATGVFNFIAVQPESYTLKIEHPGFKIAERTDVVITTNEHINLGDIQLQIGAVSDTVSVEARTANLYVFKTCSRLKKNEAVEDKGFAKPLFSKELASFFRGEWVGSFVNA